MYVNYVVYIQMNYILSYISAWSLNLRENEIKDHFV